MAFDLLGFICEVGGLHVVVVGGCYVYVRARHMCMGILGHS